MCEFYVWTVHYSHRICIFVVKYCTNQGFGNVFHVLSLLSLLFALLNFVLQFFIYILFHVNQCCRILWSRKVVMTSFTFWHMTLCSTLTVNWSGTNMLPLPSGSKNKTDTNVKEATSRALYKNKRQTNSVALSPQANYTDWAIATFRWNLVPTSVDRGVSRGQCGRSPTVVNLSFLDRSHYFSFK
jgi:hypothetical protein